MGVALPRSQPEAVHEVVIRSERQKPIGGVEATKDSQRNVIRENLSHLRNEDGFVKKQDEEDERAENLCLVYVRPSFGGIIPGDVVPDGVEVEAQWFLSFLIVNVKVVTGVVTGELVPVSFNNGSIFVVALPCFGVEHKYVSFVVGRNHLYDKGPYLVPLFSTKRSRIFRMFCQVLFV